MTKRKFVACAFFLIAVLVLAGIFTDFEKSTEYELKSAIIYREDTESYKSVYSQLQHSLNLLQTVECVRFSENTKLSDYDCIYADKSIAEGISEAEKASICSYVEEGGFLYAPNEFIPLFAPAFFGGSDFEKVGSLPEAIDFPAVSSEYTELQKIIQDFHSLYLQYQPAADIRSFDYGYGIINTDGVSLALYNGISLYGMNDYGMGYVFYGSPMLPNDFSVNNFNLESDDPKSYFANTSLTASQIIRSKFAAFVSKRIFGISFERVFGSFASPSAAWQLHYEEATGIENNAAIEFDKICREFGQIPSYTLIRNTFTWFNRTETITYFTDKKDNYKLNITEDAYTAGTHVIEDNSAYLGYATLERAGSYFPDYPQYTQTAYPAIGDFDADEIPDIISGSSDGYFYFNKGIGFSDNEWKVEKSTKLLDTSGEPLKVGAYSAPYLYDLDGDGILDIISGTQTNEIYLFPGKGGLRFGSGSLLLASDALSEAKPALDDVNNDGSAELVVGGNGSKIYIYSLNDYSLIAETENLFGYNSFLAPEVYDYNNDGENELIIGTYEGYIHIYKYIDGALSCIGTITADEMNYLGNNNLKIANNCVPRFYDIDNDGNDDLIAGSLEYGMAMPIDSPYYSGKDKLQEQVDYILDNDIYLGVHMYTQKYASAEREDIEIGLHKKALEAYGIDTSTLGSNQHTWNTSMTEFAQTFRSLSRNGIMWSSGSIANDNFIYPQSSAENTLSGPFWLDYENKKMLMLNTNTLLDSPFGDIAMKYGLPISVYYHCDLMHQNPEGARLAVTKVDGFVNDNCYTFVGEDQLMKAIAAAYNTKLSVTKLESGLKVTAKPTDTDFELYDKNFQNSVGIRAEFAEEGAAEAFACTANVWRVDAEANCIYLSLDKPAELTFSKEIPKNIITHINLPAKVTRNNDTAEIAFKEGGMMQVFTSCEVAVESDGWNVKEINGRWIIYKYGKKDTLKLRILGGNNE